MGEVPLYGASRHTNFEKDKAVHFVMKVAYLICRSAENALQDFEDINLEKWFKPMPESGLGCMSCADDCIRCAEFARTGIGERERASGRDEERQSQRERLFPLWQAKAGIWP